MTIRAVGRTHDDVYSDVEMWAKDSINELAAAEVVNGYGDGAFKPDAPISRAEAIAVMSRVFSFGADGIATEFIDVSPEHRAFGYIAN